MPTSDVDVVIVGAGAAGLAAARAAQERKLNFVVFEAMDRIGGRAHTDTETFGFPWDRGCHWLHSADVNLFTKLADQYGFRLFRQRPPYRIYRDGAPLPETERLALLAHVEEDLGTVEEVGRSGRDVSAAEVIDVSAPWVPVLRTAFAGEWSIPLEDVSTLDDSQYRDTDNNWPVIDGYGALVARHAEGIQVELSTPVRRIDWRGPRIRVETDAGTVEASAVVITVSTRVIQDHLIAFDPPLPVWKQEAYDAIQLGNANKVSFAIDRRHLGVSEYTTAWSAASERQGLYFQLSPFDLDFASGFLAGELGALCEAEGPHAMIEAGTTALVNMFGSEIRKHIRRSACSTWSTDTWIRGAYGAARPGQAHKRADLGTPIDGRLFFAGEAVSPDFFSTCHGAHETGQAVISAIAGHLKGPNPS